MQTQATKNSKPKQKEQQKFIQEPIQTVDGITRIKRYVKLKQVGSGSYSKCYLVKNTDSDSTYVAKIIPKKKLEILQKQKLVYEIKIHQSLSHQNVVHLDHWFEDESFQYIFMEYCSNGNLENKLNETGTFQQKDIRRFGEQIIHAIMYIHSQNILHRDLKLCNFYLDQNDNVKLGDFGFACQLANDFDRKRETCGTPNYIAPQAISGFGYSYSSDVWAIGVILFRLKYGFCPFQGESVKRTLQNIKVCNYRFPDKPKISLELKDLIQKIFNLNYDQRLTPQQILDHKFFHSNDNWVIDQKKELKEQKRGFSLSRLFSRDKNKSKKQQSPPKGRKSALNSQSRNPTVATPSHKKQQGPKRSNSCQTFKQIKQIFKNKSKTSLITLTQASQPYPPHSPYYTLHTINNINSVTDRQREGTAKGVTNRASIAEYSYALSLNNTMESTNLNMNHTLNGSKKEKEQQSRSNRLNQFIKSQVISIPLKQQLKVNKQGSNKNYMVVNTPNKAQKQREKDKKQIQNQYNAKPKAKIATNTNTLIISNAQKNPSKPAFSTSHQLLYNYSRRYYLPVSIQQQKDIIIIHYKPPIKQVIYSNQGYIIYKTIQNLYKFSGEFINLNELPKVLKYVIENKIQIKDAQHCEDQYEYSQCNNDINIKNILQKLPQNWNILKDGIILKYGNYFNLTIAKLYTQEGYYVPDQNGGQPFLYTIEEGTPKILEGIIIQRIYNGWMKTNGKKS